MHFGELKFSFFNEMLVKLWCIVVGHDVVTLQNTTIKQQ